MAHAHEAGLLVAVATWDGRVNPDWTFRANAGEYSVKTLQVLVRQGVPTRRAILSLGDSITYGAGGIGDYRDRLLARLDAAGRSIEFIGSSGGNPSAALTLASQVNHEGHNGYRIDQIANNLGTSDGGNNGGHWLNPGAAASRDPVAHRHQRYLAALQPRRPRQVA